MFSFVDSLRRILVLLAVGLPLAGCEEEPKDLPVTTNEIIYDLLATMDRGGDDVHRYEFYGSRKWDNVKGVIQTHYFDFDSDDDMLTLMINFNEPIIPGGQVSFIFTQVDKGGKALQAWPLLAKNVSSDYVNIFEFEFVRAPILVNPKIETGSNGSIKIVRQYGWVSPKGIQAPLRGLYELSENARYMAVLMKWKVRNPISANALYDAQ